MKLVLASGSRPTSIEIISLCIPIGRVHETQTLYLGVKGEDGKLKAKKTLPVAFVPLVSKGK